VWASLIHGHTTTATPYGNESFEHGDKCERFLAFLIHGLQHPHVVSHDLHRSRTGHSRIQHKQNVSQIHTNIVISRTGAPDEG
jgi:hypothetical protein